MNVNQLIKTELTRVLTDAENSEVAHGLKVFVLAELDEIESRLKEYIDAQFSKLSSTVATASMGKPVVDNTISTEK